MQLPTGSRIALLLAALAVTPVHHALAQGAAPEQGTAPEFPAPLVEATDEVAAALRTIWTSQFFIHEGRDQASAALQELVDAQTIVRRNPEIAARYVLSSLQLLEADDEPGHLWLIPLMALVPDDRGILAHLSEMLMSPIDRPTADPESGPPPAELVRTLALGQIASAARGGADLALEYLLGLLRSPDARVRSDAVRAFYRASPSRSAARRQMRPLLSPEHQHLLYRH